MNAVPKLAPLRDKPYLASFRDKECLARGYGVCGGDVVGHHLTLGWLARGMKCPDNHTVPLCHRHHRELHDTGEYTWWITLFNDNRNALAEVLRAAAEREYLRS